MNQSALAAEVGATGLDRVTIAYPDGTVALHAISLQLEPGEQVAIIGPSGAGKSTLLAALASALRPSSGTVSLLGCDPWSLSTSARQKLRGRLFLTPQSPPLPPRQRVVHAVLAGRLPQWSATRALRSLVYPVETAEAHQVLARLHIADKLFLRCDRLSGGERQRVGLARLILSNAHVLLLDEPVSSLDPALATNVLDTMVQEAHRRAATMVVSLHAVDLALARFPRLIGLKAGRVLFDLPRAEVSDALLTQLYGAELATSFQAPPMPSAALEHLTRCR